MTIWRKSYRPGPHRASSLAPRALGSQHTLPWEALKLPGENPLCFSWCKNTSPSGTDNEGFVSTDKFIDKEALDHIKFLSDYKGRKKKRHGL